MWPLAIWFGPVAPEWALRGMGPWCQSAKSRGQEAGSPQGKFSAGGKFQGSGSKTMAGPHMMHDFSRGPAAHFRNDDDDDDDVDEQMEGCVSITLLT